MHHFCRFSPSHRIAARAALAALTVGGLIMTALPAQAAPNATSSHEELPLVTPSTTLPNSASSNNAESATTGRVIVQFKEDTAGAES